MTYPTFTDDERERLGNGNPNNEAVVNDASWAAHNHDTDETHGAHETDASADVADTDAADDVEASVDTADQTDQDNAVTDDADDDGIEDDDAEAQVEGADTEALLVTDQADETEADDDLDDEDEDVEDPAALASDDEDDDVDDDDGDEVDDEIEEPAAIAPVGDETLVVDGADIGSDDDIDDDAINTTDTADEADDVDAETEAAIDAEAATEAGTVTTVDPGVITEDVVVADEVDEDNCASPALTDTTLDGEPVIDGHIVEPVALANGMRPGDAPVSETMVPPVDAAAIHERWQQAQLSFIDDPQAAAEAARAIATEVLESHIELLRARQAELDSWQGDNAPDTEILRAAMRGYRDMVSSLTGI